MKKLSCITFLAICALMGIPLFADVTSDETEQRKLQERKRVEEQRLEEMRSEQRLEDRRLEQKREDDRLQQKKLDDARWERSHGSHGR